MKLTAAVKYRIYVGSDVAGEEKAAMNFDTAISYYAEELTLIFGGCTVMEGEGRYKYKAGTVVEERTKIIEVLTKDERGDNIVSSVARNLAYKLGQESVLVTREHVDMGFLPSI